MDAARQHLEGARCVTAGTPVRQAFLRSFAPLETLHPPFRLLVLGGSGGARVLNGAMNVLAPELLERFPQWELLHQTGGLQALDGTPRHPRHHQAAFLDNMDQVLEATTLVITRSGASTCAELKACGRPAIMVPMPGSAGGHQMMNAQAMVAEGRALLVSQTSSGSRELAETLSMAACALMGDAALGRMAQPQANHAVETCLEDMVRVLAQP